jgi:uncharacterized protein (DUF488 family)
METPKNQFGLEICTIGHSVLQTGELIRLLAVNRIETVVDVRSIPFSKKAPQFNKSVLEVNLKDASIEYRYAGQFLGGYPDGYTSTPRTSLDWKNLSERPDFIRGIRRLIEIASETRVAILCAEENPYRCHRHLLIAPALMEAGVRVVHLRHDGSRMCVMTTVAEPDLFDYS